MATVARRDTTTGNTAGATSYASASFTPTAGDLLVALFYVSGTTTVAPTCSASANSITFTLFDIQASTGSSGSMLYRFIADQLVGGSPVAMTVTIAGLAATPTGCDMGVLGVQGMTKVGSAAIVQIAGPDNNNPVAATTPVLTLSQAPLTTNPVVFHAGNQVSTGASLTPPAGWTEYLDVGYSTPATGMEVSGVDSGFTSTTITAGSTMSIGAYGAFELDASAAAASLPELVMAPRNY